MAKQRRTTSFAEIVQEVNATPPAPVPFDLLGPGGRGYRLVDADVSAEQARQVAAEGAALGWDACGCGGDCGYRWHAPEEVARTAAAGPPELRRQGHLQGKVALLRSDEGEHLLLAHFPMRWGHLLD